VAGQDVFLTFWAPAGSGGVYRTGGSGDTTWYITGSNQSGVIDWGGLTISGTRSWVYDAELVTINTTSGAPIITSQPNNLTVTAPAGATFTVGASGDPVLTYQWRRNGVNLPGATGSSYTLNPTNAAADNGAQFDVIVNNPVGPAVTSAVATLTVNTTSGAGFVAYNDLAWATGQLTSNITTITSPNGGSGLPSSGQLIDYATGLSTPVTLTVTGGSFSGDSQAGHGANPVSGTDAHSLFNGKVSGLGAISYIDQAGSSLVLTFTGLDSSKDYDLAFYAHRDKYDWSRASLVTLSGQDSFTNTSSVATDNPNESGGVLFTGPNDTSTRLPADNDNGYVARFSNIDPGSDGRVVLTISFDGTTPFTGKYGSAVRLQEY
jgi:hypothetical protein